MRTKHLNNTQFRELLLHLESGADRAPLIAARCALIELLARTGIRAEELARLEVRCLDVAEGRLMVLDPAKGSLSRTIKLDPAYIGRLRAAIERCGLTGSMQLSELTTEGTGPKAGHAFKQSLRVFWRRTRDFLWGDSAAHMGLHCLRHTVAVRVLESTGGHVMKAKMALGHKSINSTLHYIDYLEAQAVQDDVLKAIG